MNACKNCFSFATQGNDLCLECALYDEKLRSTAVPMIRIPYGSPPQPMVTFQPDANTSVLTIDEARRMLGLEVLEAEVRRLRETETLEQQRMYDYLRQMQVAQVPVPAKVEDPPKEDYVETEWDLL